MAELKPLALSDAESVYDGILELVKKFPEYPAAFKPSNQTILWNTTADGTCIGLFPLQGAVYLRKFIDGSYVGLLPFEVVYKTSLTTNKANIAAQRFLTALCAWLEACNIDFTDTKLTLESIERTTPCFVATQSEKYTELAINMQLKYSFSNN